MDAKNEIRRRLADPAVVLEKLNLLESAKKNSAGYMIPCPWHGENEPSCSVRTHPGDGTLSVHCFGCQYDGDVFNLIAQAYGLSTSIQFAEIIQIAAGMAGVSLDDDSPRNWEPPPPRKEPPPPEYPPVDELRDMWNGAESAIENSDVIQWMTERYIKPTASDTCRVIPTDYNLPLWAIYRDETHEKGRYDWIMSGHRLIFPLYNSDGKIRSFKSRCLDSSSKLKNVNPQGYSPARLCFADDIAVDMLKNGRHVETVVFVEGEVDFLTAIQRRNDDGLAIFGIYSGAWSDEHAQKLRCDRVVFLTDNDAAGDLYIEQIKKSILTRCEV